MKRPWYRRWSIIAFAGILVLVIATSRWTLPLPARWLDVGGAAQKADAVVLLDGGLETRPFVAAALVHGGWAPKVILNTQAPNPSELKGETMPKFEIALKVLEFGGVRRDRVVRLDSNVETTFDEAKAVADYLADHPAKRILVVTEAPHTRRAGWIFQRVLAGRSVEVVMISAPSDGFDNENWWRSSDGFLFVVSEYCKLLFYGLRYGWLGYEIVAGLFVIILLGVWLKRRARRGGGTTKDTKGPANQ